jgi:hypothetical protein
MKHPHSEVITAWFNGEKCQWKDSKDRAWTDMKDYNPNSAIPLPYHFYPDTHYRIAPKPLVYKVAVYESPAATYMALVAESEWKAVEDRGVFVRWATDPFTSEGPIRNDSH